MKYLFLLGLVFVFSGVSAQSKDIHIQQINEHTYVLTKSWSEEDKANIGVVIGNDSLLLINTLMKSDITSLEKALQTISPLPVKYVINSNWDTYNHHANEHFAAQGAVIIGHENLRYRPVYTQLTFKDEMTFDYADETIKMVKSEAHSFAHINIYLRQANVVFMADSYRKDWMTVTGHNGLKGYIAGIDSALALGNSDTLYVSGNTTNFEFSSRQDLIRDKAFRRSFTELVKAQYLAGKSVDEISADETLVKLVRKQYPLRKFPLNYKVNQAIQSELTKPFHLSDKEIAEYVGSYVAPNGDTIELIYTSPYFVARSEGRFITALTATSASTFKFYPSEQGESFEFTRNAKNKVSGLKTLLNESYYKQFIKHDNWSKE